MTPQTYPSLCAQRARQCLACARVWRDPTLKATWRRNARQWIAEGKQYRTMKRQADMFRELFDYAGGRR